MGEPWSPTFSGAGAESHSAFELQAAKVSAFWVASDQWMLLKWNSKDTSHWEPDYPGVCENRRQLNFHHLFWLFKKHILVPVGHDSMPEYYTHATCMCHMILPQSPFLPGFPTTFLCSLHTRGVSIQTTSAQSPSICPASAPTWLLAHSHSSELSQPSTRICPVTLGTFSLKLEVSSTEPLEL